MEERIRQFIEEMFLFEFDESITETTDLFKAGIMDSFGYIQLCLFLEREFEIKFSEEDMLTRVLVSLSSITEFLSSKIPATSGA